MKDLDFLCKVEGLKVTFQVLSLIPANAVVSWNFGDGTNEYNKPKVTHQYGEMGIYPIDLTVETSKGTYGKGAKVLMLSTITKTHLSDSIYNLINEYIPHEISEGMTSSQKSVFINKWQLYIQPLVSRPRGKEIPIDEYHPEYVKTPISDFPISSICKIFAEEGEWTLEIHKFATVTI